MNVQAYLFFDGRCEEALEFYKRAIGAQVQAMIRFNESPEPPPPGTVAPGSEKKIMHASFSVGDTVVMASDGYAKGKPEFKGFSLSINTKSEGEADRLFNALAADGQVQMPLGKTFFSPKFGMLTDRFGVAWMVHVEA